jgi:hypothetical protein
VLLFSAFSPPIAGLTQEVTQMALREERIWLEFNHHLGGIVVLVLAALTWLELLGTVPILAVTVGWPSCLMFIGLYNLFLSDRFAWPIGPLGLLDSLSNPEVFQHKSLAIMVLILGLIELFRRLELITEEAWLYVFYGLAVLTAGILMMHDFDSHRHESLHGVTTSHVWMGLLAFITLVLKVLIDRRIIIGRLKYLYPFVLVVLGLQLLIFTELSDGVR